MFLLSVVFGFVCSFLCVRRVVGGKRNGCVKGFCVCHEFAVPVLIGKS